jgi:hypothetical protein
MACGHTSTPTTLNSSVSAIPQGLPASKNQTVACIENNAAWATANCLQLNAAKTEVLCMVLL